MGSSSRPNVGRHPTGTYSPCTLNRLQQFAFPVFGRVPIGCRPIFEPLTSSLDPAELEAQNEPGPNWTPIHTEGWLMRV